MSSILGNTIHSIQSVLSHHQIEKLTHRHADLDSAASSHYARGLCSMPNLRTLDMDGVELSDEFYSTMAYEASKSKVNQEAAMNGDPVQEAPLKPSVAPRVFCFPYRNPLNPSPRPYSSLVALSPPVAPTAQASEHGGLCVAGPHLGEKW